MGGGVIINHPHQTSLLSSLYAMGAISILSRRYEKTHELTHPTPPLRSKNIFRTMFGWFGEVGGTKKNHTHRCASSFYYLAERKVRKTTKIIFRVLTVVIRHRFLFLSQKPQIFFVENTKRRAPEFGSKSAPSKVDLEPYGAIWCQIGSQFLSLKQRIRVRVSSFWYRRNSIPLGFSGSLCAAFASFRPAFQERMRASAPSECAHHRR
jgi:hypothetical protein